MILPMEASACGKLWECIFTRYFDIVYGTRNLTDSLLVRIDCGGFSGSRGKYLAPHCRIRRQDMFMSYIIYRLLKFSGNYTYAYIS